MSPDDDSNGSIERRDRGGFLLGSALAGVVAGLLLSPVAPPFGLAAGLFGGSAATFFLLLAVSRFRQ